MEGTVDIPAASATTRNLVQLILDETKILEKVNSALEKSTITKQEVQLLKENVNKVTEKVKELMKKKRNPVYVIEAISELKEIQEDIQEEKKRALMIEENINATKEGIAEVKEKFSVVSSVLTCGHSVFSSVSSTINERVGRIVEDIDNLNNEFDDNLSYLKVIKGNLDESTSIIDTMVHF